MALFQSFCCYCFVFIRNVLLNIVDYIMCYFIWSSHSHSFGCTVLSNLTPTAELTLQETKLTKNLVESIRCFYIAK